MLIKKPDFCPGLRFFFFFLFLFFLCFLCRRGVRGIALTEPTDVSFPMDPNGNSFPLTPPKPPRGLGVKGVEAIQAAP